MTISNSIILLLLIPKHEDELVCNSHGKFILWKANFSSGLTSKNGRSFHAGSTFLPFCKKMQKNTIILNVWSRAGFPPRECGYFSQESSTPQEILTKTLIIEQILTPWVGGSDYTGHGGNFFIFATMLGLFCGFHGCYQANLELTRKLLEQNTRNYAFHDFKILLH